MYKRKRSKIKSDSFEPAIENPLHKNAPTEIWTTVFNFIPKKDVIHSARFVCQDWNNIILSLRHIWNSVSYRELNHSLIPDATQFVRWASSTFSRFEQLQELNLSCHYGYHYVFTEEHLRGMRTHCPSLTTLRIICDQMDDRTLDFVTADYKSLRCLQIAVPFQRKIINIVTEKGVEFFNRMNLLESLHLENVRFTSEATTEFVKNVVPRLRHLTLPYNSPTSLVDLLSHCCTQLESLKCIRTFNSPETAATSELCRPDWLATLLQNCKQLRHLELGYFLVFNSEMLNELIRFGIGHFYAFNLMLENSVPLSKASFLFVPQTTAFTNLKVLKLHSDDTRSSPSEWNVLLRSIADSCPNLFSLDLQISVESEECETGLERIFDKCKNLLKFSIQYPRADPLLLTLTNKDLSLTKFSLWTNWSASDQAICSFLPSCTRVTVLEFTCWSASNITDISLCAIARECPHIVCLCLERARITDEGMNQLPEIGLGKLRYFDIGDCSLISTEAADAFTRRYKNKCRLDPRIHQQERH